MKTVKIVANPNRYKILKDEWLFEFEDYFQIHVFARGHDQTLFLYLYTDGGRTCDKKQEIPNMGTVWFEEPTTELAWQLRNQYFPETMERG